MDVDISLYHKMGHSCDLSTQKRICFFVVFLSDVSSFEIIKDGDYTTSIELECSNISKQDLEKIEKLYIQTYDCVNRNLKMTDQEKKEKRIEVLNCECGMTYTKNHKARHEQSFYHKNYINTKNRQAMNIATQINITNLTINQAP